MELNLKRGLNQMFSGFAEDWQKRIDDQAEFERQEKIAQSKMLKQREQYTWEKAQETQAQDAANANLRSRLKANGWSDQEIEAHISGAPVPFSTRLDQAGQEAAAKVDATVEAKQKAIDENQYLTEDQKRQAHVAAAGVAPNAAEVKYGMAKDILDNAEKGPDGEPMLTKEDQILLSSIGVDLKTGGGFKMTSANYTTMVNKAISDAEKDFKENPPTADELAMIKTQMSQENPTEYPQAASISDTDATNYAKNKEVDRLISTGKSKWAQHAGGDTAMAGPGTGRPTTPPPAAGGDTGGGGVPEGKIEVTQDQIAQIAAVDDQRAIQVYNSRMMKQNKQGTSDPRVAKNGLLKMLANGERLAELQAVIDPQTGEYLGSKAPGSGRAAVKELVDKLPQETAIPDEVQFGPRGPGRAGGLSINKPRPY